MVAGPRSSVLEILAGLKATLSDHTDQLERIEASLSRLAHPSGRGDEDYEKLVDEFESMSPEQLGREIAEAETILARQVSGKKNS